MSRWSAVADTYPGAPDAALHIVSPDVDTETCLNLAMLAASALRFAVREFDVFQLGCIEASTEAEITEWALQLRPELLSAVAEMLANGIIAAGEAS